MSEKRPPPYFPQSSLSPSDENRYKKIQVDCCIINIGLSFDFSGIGSWSLLSNFLACSIKKITKQ